MKGLGLVKDFRLMLFLGSGGCTLFSDRRTAHCFKNIVIHSTDCELFSEKIPRILA
jgi:hypothetical protein